jgi:hypothetical protein
MMNDSVKTPARRQSRTASDGRKSAKGSAVTRSPSRVGTGSPLILKLDLIAGLRQLSWPLDDNYLGRFIT